MSSHIRNIWSAFTVIFQLRVLKSRRCGKTWIKITSPGNAGGECCKVFREYLPFVNDPCLAASSRLQNP